MHHHIIVSVKGRGKKSLVFLLKEEAAHVIFASWIHPAEQSDISEQPLPSATTSTPTELFGRSDRLRAEAKEATRPIDDDDDDDEDERRCKRHK